MIDGTERQIDARTKQRLLFGLTGVFLWPGLSGVLVFIVLEGTAGGSTTHQPRGLVGAHGRVRRIDDAHWDVLRLFETSGIPIVGALLAVACCVFIYESKRGTITMESNTLRSWAIVHLWLCVALSVFVLLAPFAWMLLRQ